MTIGDKPHSRHPQNWGSRQTGIGPTICELSDRLMEVAALVAVGETSKEIARRLGISASTVGWAFNKFMSEQSMSAKNSNLPQSASLAGCWVSRFHFKSKRPGTLPIEGYQFGLEVLSVAASGNLRGQVAQAIRTDGHPAFEHELVGSVRENQFLGTWENVNAPNFGCFLLRISGNGMNMNGYYAGTARDGFVRFDRWDWIRVVSGQSLEGIEPHEFEGLLDAGNGIALREKGVAGNRG
jgi:Bacterial regulatory proteins, luxR family